jgi:MFS family permease
MDDGQRDRWYTGVTRYQWLVLAIASLGWVFDIFESQIFVATRKRAMEDLLPGATAGQIAFAGDVIYGVFLIGGACGGVFFGLLSDRIGRTRTMIVTILAYTLFTGLSALAVGFWDFAVYRFLVALGTGGEWAVASAFVAEVFPTRARAWSLAIFHASSVLGTYLAVAVGMTVVATWGWRWGFALGTAPALLTLWIRSGLRESDAWTQARSASVATGAPRTGVVADLFRDGRARRTLLAVGLATVGLATFWGAHVKGKDVLRANAEVRLLGALPDGATEDDRKQVEREAERWDQLGMFLVTTGGGIGLVTFGPLSDRLGRRGAFLCFFLGGFAATLVLFRVLSGVLAVALFLPVFGFLTVGAHAGYAVYFPELFPTRLRGTGAGFCFNVGRLTAAPLLFLSGWFQDLGLSLSDVASLLSILFLVGAGLLAFAPETKGKHLE